jgi:general secretion pathway protein D
MVVIFHGDLWGNQEARMSHKEKPFHNEARKKHKKDLSDFLVIFIVCLNLASCRTTSELAREVLDRHHIQALKDVPEMEQPSSKFHFQKKKKLSPEVPVALKKCVSVAITEEVPLKDAFIELARQAEVDLQLDSKVAARIVLVAHKRPLIEVISDICDIAGLRYKIIGASIRVEVDNPYAVNYSLPYLNLTRTAENRISIATDVFSSVKDNKSSADNGSNSAIVGKGNNDFWTELDGNLKTILSSEQVMKEGESKAPTYSLHRQGGLVSVYGTSRQHRLVEQYLNSLRQVVSSQVLIEAKVIEVSLKDQYKSGINWQKLAGGAFHTDIDLGDLAQRGRFMDPTSAQTDMLTFGLQGKTFSSLLKAIEEFGASRTLSSPRLTVMNNQTAILKVAQNQVYFRLNYDKQLNIAVNRESINVSSDIQTVPIGLVMSVQPAIDHETGDIILSLRPTISRLTHSVSDPAVEIAYANAKTQSTVKPKPSLIPVVEVREIDSVLRLQSGEIAVLGGLMEARTTNGTAKVPVAGDIPILGQLFTASADGDEVVELVILLRASIIEGSAYPDPADQRLYQDYLDDPRPLEMG